MNEAKEKFISEVFSAERRRYGADQGALLRTWERNLGDDQEKIRRLMTRVLKKKLSDENILSYLKRLNFQGCGFAAATNIIFERFAGRAAEFGWRYGINYYDEQGRVNLNELLLTFYHAENNWRHIPLTSVQFKFLYPGVRAGDLRVNIQVFTKKHGEEITGRWLWSGSDLQTRQELVSGKLVTLTCYLNQMHLIAPGNASYKTVDSRFHTVTLTGYDEDREAFVVSSWGNKYFLPKLPPIVSLFSY
ncbi:hypothetical protein ACWN8V_01575 [Vagococcus elongatus]|uniref:Uncharacterized protein n=1 Tax=Vagococcus elongatus TaxID=180344 RepID=A0A430B4H7_9ENTE|nr:hypothetical protein [Vagococcus elongatus]RSU15260.1 hypothetical protein CBF29_02700 [Vagococcus elongatus]